MRDGGWVTEDPREHLAHHLTRASERPGSGVALLGIEEDEGALHVTVRPTEPGTHQDVRGAAMGLIGYVLEGSTFVRERRSGDAFEFDVATGMMPGEAGFTGHGHVLRLTVEGPAGDP